MGPPCTQRKDHNAISGDLLHWHSAVAIAYRTECRLPRRVRSKSQKQVVEYSTVQSQIYPAYRGKRNGGETTMSTIEPTSHGGCLAAHHGGVVSRHGREASDELHVVRQPAAVYPRGDRAESPCGLAYPGLDELATVIALMTIGTEAGCEGSVVVPWNTKDPSSEIAHTTRRRTTAAVLAISSNRTAAPGKPLRAATTGGGRCNPA